MISATRKPGVDSVEAEFFVNVGEGKHGEEPRVFTHEIMTNRR